MSNYIGNFYKSDHFNFRQWDRRISDHLLAQILKNIEPNKCNTLFIVSRKVLRRLNKNLNKELFIKVDNKTLITCFYCEFKEYNPSKKEQNYLIISEI